MSKLEEVSHDILVFLRPRVSSRVSGFPVASPCLWGSKVSKQVVMLFCMAGLALCNIPNCLIKTSKVSKLEDLPHERLVLMIPRVSSRFSGFPLASPCLWGKLQNL